MGPKFSDEHPYKKQKRKRHRDTQSEAHMKTEAGIGMTRLQDKEHQALPASTRRGREAWYSFSLSALRRDQHCQCLVYGLLAARTVRV